MIRVSESNGAPVLKMRDIMRAQRKGKKAMHHAVENIRVVESCFLDKNGQPVEVSKVEDLQQEKEMAMQMEVETMQPITGSEIMERTYVDDRVAFDVVAFMQVFDKKISAEVGGEEPITKEVVEEAMCDAVQQEAPAQAEEDDLVLENGCWYRDRSGCSIQVFRTAEVAVDLPEPVKERYPFCKQNGTDFFTVNGIHYGTASDEDLIEKITPTMGGATQQ